MGATDVQALLESVRPRYAAARRLYEELQALQSVEQAHAAFKDLLGDEERRVESLRQRVSALEREKQSLVERLELAGNQDPETDPWADDAWDAGPAETAGEQGRPEEHQTRPEEIAKPLMLTQARKRFQAHVSRFGHFLRVSEATQAQINQIVEDPQRPLGEALVLLDWDAFAGRIDLPGVESEDRYVERLKEWGDSLLEYTERAEGDVRAVKVRYGHFVMLLWEAWRAANSGDPTQWEKLIADTRRAYAHQAADFEKQAAALEADVAGLQLELGSGGTHGR